MKTPNRAERIIAMLNLGKRRTYEFLNTPRLGAEYRAAISEARRILAKESPPKFIEAARVYKGVWEYAIVDQPPRALTNVVMYQCGEEVNDGLD